MSVHRWEGRCLADDPFAGDYGGSGGSDRVLSDRMVTARKGGDCQACGQNAEPGTRNRVRCEVYDGELMVFRWCEPCCFGMAVYDVRPSILDRRIAFRKAAAFLQSNRQGEGG